MEISLNDIAKKIGGSVSGNGSVMIKGAAGLEEAKESDISFVRDSKNAKAAKAFSGTKAGAVIVPEDFNSNGKTVVKVKNPIAGFAQILELISNEKKPPFHGIHPLAYVAKNAKIGPSVSIGPYCVIEDDAHIAEGVTLVAHVYVGPRVKIGKSSLIYPHVVLREEIQIGERCIVHGGAVIGSDGFGFFFADGRHNKIPQIGNVIIEDDVEIGSNTSIDRATTGSTVIRKGTKIDNMVQIAHNVEVGSHSLLAAQAGIAGSSSLGPGVVLAGQVGIADHVKIGAGTQVGAQSGVKGDVEPGSVLFGSPAQPIGDTIRQTLLIRRLPELFKDVKNLKEKK